ncbi:biotin--[acetyl-CoA-carboxylase] ligase [bacterium]|nr:biotin--[acetyl-CoA-carboxylase] ligase [bacterium]
MSFAPDTFRSFLQTRWLGQDLAHFADIDSTSAHLKREARSGTALTEGLVVLADAQSAGYGQHGRAWSSAEQSGLYTSIWLPAHYAQRPLTLLAGVATVEALRELTAQESIGLKWVNDLVAQGRKLGGILAEMVGGPGNTGGRHGLILGIGLNLAAQEARPEAIALSHLAPLPSREQILASMLNRLEHWLDRVTTEGEEVLCDRWRTYSVTLGQHVRAQLHTETIEGFAEDITRTGALCIRRPDGTMREIASGTVRLADGRYC